MLELIVYKVFCVFTELCGIEGRIGIFRTFVLALLVSPLVVLPMLLITASSRRIEWRRQS